MRTILVLCLALAALPSLAQEWRVVEGVDSMTDEQRRAAIVTNADGYTASVYRVDGGRVYMSFRMPKASSLRLSKSRLPMMRVDKLRAHDFESLRRSMSIYRAAEIVPFVVRDDYVSAYIWHGKQTQGVSEIIVHLMEGQRLLLRFYLQPEGTEETEFPLTNAKQAISSALGIAAEIDPLQQEAARAYREAIAEGMRQCTSIAADRNKSRSELEACLERYKKCRAEAPSDAVQFRECILR